MAINQPFNEELRLLDNQALQRFSLAKSRFPIRFSKAKEGMVAPVSQVAT